MIPTGVISLDDFRTLLLLFGMSQQCGGSELRSRLVVPQLPDRGDVEANARPGEQLAGDLTLVGSIADLIVLEGARRHGVEISCRLYRKVGVPVTLPTLPFGMWRVA
jgi:hypothetical protein